MQQNSALPTNKVWAGGIAAAVVVIVVWAVQKWGQIEIPAEVATALTGIISAIAGYFTPPASRDTITEIKP